MRAPRYRLVSGAIQIVIWPDVDLDAARICKAPINPCKTPIANRQLSKDQALYLTAHDVVQLEVGQFTRKRTQYTHDFLSVGLSRTNEWSSGRY